MRWSKERERGAKKKGHNKEKIKKKKEKRTQQPTFQEIWEQTLTREIAYQSIEKIQILSVVVFLFLTAC